MITLTDRAAQQVREQLQRRGHGLGVRVGVETTGCSGLAYVLEYVDTVHHGDHVFESNGVHVYVDGRSLDYLRGLSMDWTRQGLNEGFEFTNPNERDRCGCGESFRV